MAYNGYLLTGFTSTGSIVPANEVDSFGTTLLRGLTYSARVSAYSSGGGTLYDPVLTLRNAGGAALLQNDDISATNLDSQLTFTVGQTGNYGLYVQQSSASDTGTYTISLSIGYGSNNGEQVVGSASGDGVNGLGGNDSIWGYGGNDRIWGDLGNDQLIGGVGNDSLNGGAGNDSIWGQDGNDQLLGGGGTDQLVGGRGNDIFIFYSVADSANGAPDVIAGGDGAIAFEGAGVAGGDIIDLRLIDANPNQAGDQSFVGGVGGVGRIWLGENTATGDTSVYLSIDGDAAPEFTLIIRDGAGITAYDYNLNTDFYL